MAKRKAAPQRQRRNASTAQDEAKAQDEAVLAQNAGAYVFDGRTVYVLEDGNLAFPEDEWMREENGITVGIEKPDRDGVLALIAARETELLAIDYAGDLDLSLQGALDLLGDEGLSGEYERLKGIAKERWREIRESTDDASEQIRLLDEFVNGEFIDTWKNFGNRITEVWNQNKNDLNLLDYRDEALATLRAFGALVEGQPSGDGE